MGPFRFRGAEYRAALTALLDGDLPGSRRRVLLIGARVALLARLAAALRTIGIGADITQSADGVPAGELRSYGAVLFGRSAPARERDAVRRALAGAGADVPCVDALAPVVPLLVAQTEQALEAGRDDHRRLTDLTAAAAPPSSRWCPPAASGSPRTASTASPARTAGTSSTRSSNPAGTASRWIRPR